MTPDKSGSTSHNVSEAPPGEYGRVAAFPWAIAAQVVAISSLLLPVVGAVVRYVAFGFDSRIDRALSVASPVPELAYLGFWTALPALVFGGLGILLFRTLGPDIRAMNRISADLAEVRARTDEVRRRAEALAEDDSGKPEDPDQRRAWHELSVSMERIGDSQQLIDEALAAGPSSRLLALTIRLIPPRLNVLLVHAPIFNRPWAPIGAALIASLPLSVFVLDVSTLPLVVGLAVASYIFAKQSFEGPSLSLGVVLWPLLLLLAASAITSGLSNSQIPSSAISISLTDEQSTDMNWYSRIAQADGITYFLPCDAAHPVIGVRSDRIASLSYAAHIPAQQPDASLWSVLAGGQDASLGYRARCPGP